MDIVASEPDLGSSSRLRGHVDECSIDAGIVGWALNVEALDLPVRLELVAGGIVFAETETYVPRTDVSESIGLGHSIEPGFHFDLDQIARCPPEVLDKKMEVRVAGSLYVLPAATALPTASSLSSESRQASSKRPQIAERPTVHNLRLHLDDLREAAGPLVQLPMRPIPENLCGFIELVASDSSGLVWIMGWMDKSRVLEFSAVITQRRKFAAGVILTGFGRTDIPSSACGIIGVIASEWRPGSDADAAFLYFNLEKRRYLRTLDTLSILSAEDFANEFAARKDVYYDVGRATTLRDMLLSQEVWQPTNLSNIGFAVTAAVDRALIIPDFGCLIEGWIISPAKRIQQLCLRLGTRILHCEPTSLHWRSREDLSAPFPEYSAIVNRAGFVATFAGEFSQHESPEILLKFIYADGTSTNHAAPHQAIRVLGHSATIADLVTYYPTLKDEQFFPAIAATIRRQAHGYFGSCLPIVVRQSKTAAIFALPPDRCDLYLVFEELTQQARMGAPLPALTFVSPNSENRTDVLALFNDLTRNEQVVGSLFFVDDAEYALQTLSAVLPALKAEQFLYVGRGVFLTKEARELAMRLLCSELEQLVIFERMDLRRHETSGPDSPDLSLACFAWNSRDYLSWSQRAMACLGGGYDKAALKKLISSARIFHRSAVATRSRTLSPLIEAINCVPMEEC